MLEELLSQLVCSAGNEQHSFAALVRAGVDGFVVLDLFCPPHCPMDGFVPAAAVWWPDGPVPVWAGVKLDGIPLRAPPAVV